MYPPANSVVSGNKRSSLRKPSLNINAAVFSPTMKLNSQCSAHQLPAGASTNPTEAQNGPRFRSSAATPSEVISGHHALHHHPHNNSNNKLHSKRPITLPIMELHPSPSPKPLVKTSKVSTWSWKEKISKRNSMLRMSTPTITISSLIPLMMEMYASVHAANLSLSFEYTHLMNFIPK